MTSISEDSPTRRVEIKSTGMLSNFSLEKVAYSANENNLLDYSSHKVIKALLHLRIEKKNLKQLKVPSSTSSVGRNVNKELPLKPDWGGQQEQNLELAHEELSRVQKELSDVQKECEQESLKSTEAEKQRKRAIKELAQMSKVHANPFDDQDFKEQVELLLHKVDHWVRNQDWSIVNDGADNARTASNAFDFLRSTSPYYLDYVSSPRGVERLIEACIWQFLARKVFGQKIWALSLRTYKREDQKLRIRSRNDLLDLHFDLGK